MKVRQGWEQVDGRWVLVSYRFPSRTFRTWFPVAFSAFAVALAVWNLIR